jgi:hypothetical protein
MRFLQRHALQLGVIIVGGFVVMSSPASARAAKEQPGGCTWCRSECPSSVTEYCASKGCPVAATSCSNAAGCQGASGEWYTYKIICGSAN